MRPEPHFNNFCKYRLHYQQVEPGRIWVGGGVSDCCFAIAAVAFGAAHCHDRPCEHRHCEARTNWFGRADVLRRSNLLEAGNLA